MGNDVTNGSLDIEASPAAGLGTAEGALAVDPGSAARDKDSPWHTVEPLRRPVELQPDVPDLPFLAEPTEQVRAALREVVVGWDHGCRDDLSAGTKALTWIRVDAIPRDPYGSNRQSNDDRGTAVTINSVLGGPTYSDGVAFTVEALAAEQSVPPETLKAAIIGQNPTTLLGRFLAPAEIAHLVTYLASPHASATNGAAVRADGGALTGLL